MHEWKYREAAELSPGAMRRLRGRFLALLRTIQGTHEVGQIQSKLRQSGPDAVRSVRPQRTAQRAGKRSKAKVPPPGGATPQQSGLPPSSVAEARRESVLQERRSVNAPRVPSPLWNSAERTDCAAADGASTGDDAESEAEVEAEVEAEAELQERAQAEAEAEAEAELRAAGSPFSEQSATDRELLAGWLRRRSPARVGEAELRAEEGRPHTLASVRGSSP